ncbi:MAG TPA: hypothetical protein VK146_10645, partial [Tabrizicola sp.]|nr:hypothetical protein [Tabrizicola sp.]
MQVDDLAVRVQGKTDVRVLPPEILEPRHQPLRRKASGKRHAHRTVGLARAQRFKPALDRAETFSQRLRQQFAIRG